MNKNINTLALKRFEGQVVIVTGAGSGIGEATARRFSEEGASVVLAGRHRDKLHHVAADLPADRTLVVTTDVSRYDEVEALVRQTVARFGALHVLVSNAGIATEGDVLEDKLENFTETINTNVGGVVHGARAALPELKKTRGCIVNTASVSGLGGDWGMAFYNASKGAIVNLTHALALDHGKDGIRVNAVCPSLTLTPMTEDMQKDKTLMAKFNERIALGRPAQPGEIAAAIAFLASADASFITGVNLPVDGGLTASNGQPPGG
ncbi:MAG: SDR family oxidoreductase [Polaromonas sp.]|nr:SDR family oxidoreductase [Polaromonas sp.]